MFPTDADPLAAMLAGAGADGTPLPALPLAGMAPAPMAPAGRMAPPGPPSVDLASHHSAADFVRMLMPLLTTAIAGARNPQHGAAIARGMARGGEMARRERMDAQQQTADRQKIQQHFVGQVMDDVRALKDPVQQQQYLAMMDDIGTQSFGLPKGWSAQVPVNRTSQTDLLKGEIEKKLTAFDKDPRWKAVSGTPDEGKISFQLSNGQSMSVPTARRLVNQSFTDAQGQPAYAPPAGPKDGTSDEAQYRRVLIQEFKDKHQRDPNTSELRQIFEDAKSGRRITPAVGSFEDFLKRSYGDTPTPAQIAKARRDYGDAGRAAPINITIPGLEGMSAKERVESAAQDIVAKRLAPSQLATFFTGMGKESASQLRSLVMQRVKQIEPEFNFAKAESDYLFGKSTGTQTTVRYLDNVAKTIPLLRKANATFKRGNIRFINDLIKSGKSQFGDVDVADFEFKRTLLADEIAKVLQGGGTGSGTSDAKLHQALELLNGNLSPAQFETVLNAADDMLKVRRETLTKGTVNETPTPQGGGTQIGRFKVRVVGGG